MVTKVESIRDIDQRRFENKVNDFLSQEIDLVEIQYSCDAFWGIYTALIIYHPKENAKIRTKQSDYIEYLRTNPPSLRGI